MFARFALAVCSLALPFAALAPLAAQNPLARARAKAQHPFVGQYAGGGTRLELTWDDDKGRYAGTLTAGEAKCPVEAAEKGEVLEGAFRSDGTRYTFTLRARGAKFVLTSDGEDHELERQNAGDTPAPAPAPAKPVAPAKAPGVDYLNQEVNP